MCVAGGVAEVVFSAVFVHPGGFEEAAGVVVRREGEGSKGVEDLQVADGRGELVHVGGEFGTAGGEGGDGGARGFMRAREGSIEVGFVVPALELPAPEAAEVEICLTIVVDKTRRVDAVTPPDGFGVRCERSFGAVGDGDADAEDSFVVAGGEVQVIGAVFEGGVGGPELFGYPGDLVCEEGDAVVGDGAGDVGEGEDVVVGHGVLVAVVVEGDGGFNVLREMVHLLAGRVKRGGAGSGEWLLERQDTYMGRIDIDLAFKDVRRRVGGVDVRYQWFRHGGQVSLPCFSMRMVVPVVTVLSHPEGRGRMGRQSIFILSSRSWFDIEPDL